MTRILLFLKNIVKFAFKRYKLALVLTIVLTVGISILWKQLSNTQSPEVRNISSQTQPTINPDENPSNELPVRLEEDDEDEEPEEDIDDNTSNSSSPWTLLNTALPSRYQSASITTGKPAIAIIITGLGISNTVTEKVLTTLQPNVCLAFSPYCTNLKGQLQRAAKQGYETLVALPMEPNTYPNTDPGPYTVLTSVNPIENINKVKRLLENVPKGMAIIGEHGSQFSLSKTDLEPILHEIRNHGSLFIDPSTTMHSQISNTCQSLDMKCLQIDLALPHRPHLQEQNDFLNKILLNVKENGIIIISVPATPVLIDQLPIWIDTLEQNGIRLIKVTEFAPLTLGLLKGDTLTGPLNPPQELTEKQESTTNANGQDPH